MWLAGGVLLAKDRRSCDTGACWLPGAISRAWLRKGLGGRAAALLLVLSVVSVLVLLRPVSGWLVICTPADAWPALLYGL